jgi:hypothetical protein
VTKPDRAKVWRRLGAPAEQVGSANDPRVVREHGVAWNEKWVHVDEHGKIERVVLWDRYDLVAIFRVDASGEWHPDPFSEE